MRQKHPPHALPPEEALHLVAAFFAALADPMRIKLVHALMGGDMSVNALVQATGGLQPNVSRHLRKLTLASVLNHRKHGTQVIYSIGDPAVYGLCQQVCGSIEKRLTQQARVIGGVARR